MLLLRALQGRRRALDLVEHDANARHEGFSSLSLFCTHDHSPETLALSALSLACSLSRACARVCARSLSPAPRAARLVPHASRPLRLAALLAPLARPAREICREPDRFDNRNNRSSEGGGGRHPIGMVPYNVFAAACGNEVTLNETLETGFPLNLLDALIVSSTNYSASCLS